MSELAWCFAASAPWPDQLGPGAECGHLLVDDEPTDFHVLDHSSAHPGRDRCQSRLTAIGDDEVRVHPRGQKSTADHLDRPRSLYYLLNEGVPLRQSVGLEHHIARLNDEAARATLATDVHAHRVLGAHELIMPRPRRTAEPASSVFIVSSTGVCVLFTWRRCRRVVGLYTAGDGPPTVQATPTEEGRRCKAWIAESTSSGARPSTGSTDAAGLVSVGPRLRVILAVGHEPLVRSHRRAAHVGSRQAGRRRASWASGRCCCRRSSTGASRPTTGPSTCSRSCRRRAPMPSIRPDRSRRCATSASRPGSPTRSSMMSSADLDSRDRTTV